MSDLDRRLAAIAARQHSLITALDLAAAGGTDRAAALRVEESRWQHVQPKVWLVGSEPPTWLQRQHAACLSSGPWTVSSHRGAAALRGLDGINEGAIEISVPVGHQPHLRGVIVHRTRRLEAIDITTYRGIPTTTVTRTLIDLGAVVPRLVVERALEDALRRGLTTEGAIVRRLAEIGGRGCRGVGVMRLVLSRRLEGRPRSGAEVMLLDLLREAGIEGLARAHPIRLNGRVIAEVDLAIPHLRIAIEFDSKKYRMRVREFERGSERAQLLASLGWVVIPVTWEQLTKRPDQVVAAVLRTISNIVLSPA